MLKMSCGTCIVWLDFALYISNDCPMALKVQYEFLFAGRDEGSFLENYAYEVNEHRGSGGHVFVCLEIQNNPSEAEAMGEAVFSALKTTFFAEAEGGEVHEGYLRFENSLKAINRAISDFRKGKLNKHIGTVHAVVAAIEGSSLYLSQCGDSEAYLIRKRFVSIVSEGLYDPSQKDGDLFMSIANGDLEPGDFVLFCTTRVLRYITKVDLSRIILANSVQRTLSDLRDHLSGEILGRIGFVGVGTSLLMEKKSLEEEDTEVFEDYGTGEKTSVVASFGPLMQKAKKYHRIMMDRVRGSKIFEKTGLFGRFASNVQYRLTREDGITKDKILALFIVVILLLSGGIWMVRHGQIKSAELLSYEQKLQGSSQMISDAESQAQTDKKAAGVILQSAEDRVKEVLNSGQYRDKAREILTKIQSARDVMDNIKHVTATVTADLSSQGVDSAIGMISGKDRYYVFDAQKLYQVMLDKVQAPLSFEQNEAIISGTYFDEKDEPVFFSKSGKLYELKAGSLRQMTTQEGGFRKGVQITDWGSRLYVLDPTSDQLWRYPFVKSKDSFGAAEGYKTDGKMSSAVAFTIDSNVFVVNSDGVLERYYGGVKQALQIDKAPFAPMTHPTKIYTDSEMSQLFVLDGARIFVYTKEPKTQGLVYMYQIIVDGLSDIRDISLDKSTGKLYLLGAQKMYSLSL